MTAARVATDTLTRALVAMAAKGQTTNCSDPTLGDIWLSEHEGERREAMRLCRGCPVLTVCRDTAEQRGERWGVWGGWIGQSDQDGRKPRELARQDSQPRWRAVEGSARVRVCST